MLLDADHISRTLPFYHGTKRAKADVKRQWQHSYCVASSPVNNFNNVLIYFNDIPNGEFADITLIEGDGQAHALAMDTRQVVPLNQLYVQETVPKPGVIAVDQMPYLIYKKPAIAYKVGITYENLKCIPLLNNQNMQQVDPDRFAGVLCRAFKPIYTSLDVALTLGVNTCSVLTPHFWIHNEGIPYLFSFYYEDTFLGLIDKNKNFE